MISRKKSLLLSLVFLAILLLVPIAHFLPHDHDHNGAELGLSPGHAAFYQYVVLFVPLLLVAFFLYEYTESMTTRTKLAWLSYRALFIDDPNKRLLATGIMHLNRY